ncbi:oligosaccharide flippase family protein [uncultured Flavobacterium sp.]|uniref:oligosaccharide flippase family protein n=1 Tax=uncultured Flavobacterium sp. TaxID=165435 RepID=UPI0030ECD650|tara:strand:- start:100759 stop:102222 length:1464 start_codon:yes stop_codon:yes gene_type:complete
MGIVLNQSLKNTVITYIGFAIGAINTLYMYVQFLGDTYYGLVGYILSTANIMMPLMAFGVHNTLVKYFNEYKTEEEKSTFLTFVLFLPLILIVPFSLIGYFGYHQIASLLSQKNPIVYDYVWQIPVIGLCMGYFEIFYAWVKVHMKSVLGNFIKEVFIRILVTISLLAVYFNWITPNEFVYTLMAIYLASMIIMKGFAYKVRFPSFKFKLPSNYKAIITYSLFIILTGGIANLFLEIDKFMLNSYVDIENIAYYSVAIFIATVIAVPSRAMHQITYPITAKLMSENKHDELNDLYKKSSITLQVVGGLIFLGILVNINELYLLLPPKYAGGVFVVFTIGLSKYFDLILGNNNAIIFNSKYYKTVLFLGVMLVALTVVLNMIFIPLYGLEGTAFATMISITLYSLAKLLFVVKRMKLFPFTSKTIVAFGILIACFFGFYFWEFTFHPIINIVLKSILVSIIYVVLSYKMNLSTDINLVIDKVLNKFKS